jgi:hypothetical protein
MCTPTGVQLCPFIHGAIISSILMYTTSLKQIVLWSVGRMLRRIMTCRKTRNQQRLLGWYWRSEGR